METPPALKAAASDRAEITITKREYDDEQIVAVDFGPTDGKPSLDIVDGMAIVVVNDNQFEFEVPADAADVTVNDGVLTITG
ncbi:DUF7127 family protein [Natronorubrum texcoconense]|uniref:Hsp20/alpha crystallin family protein n=1 Tax=Natronorubrum texcoconense TaxID=1095776 RepID=A0A1G9B8P9_9EURY|nr:hypothetical protein [Natronorubrum texcoconense]SDK35946.1 hypothetical protein SAMN04515672_2871 [Natronorubrum texcoconense]